MLLRLGLSIGLPTFAFQFIRVCQRVRLSPHATQLLELWQLVNFTWFSTSTSEFAISINSVRTGVCPCVCASVLRQNKWRKELHMQIVWMRLVLLIARVVYRSDCDSESDSDLAQARVVCVLASRCRLCSAHLSAGDFTLHPDLRFVISRNQSRRPKQVEINPKEQPLLQKCISKNQILFQLWICKSFLKVSLN